MVRKVDVRKHDRTLPSGEIITVRKHKRSVPFDMDKFEPLSEKWAENFIEKRYRETHPDAINKCKVCFLYPNPFWVKHPERYDVFKLDCEDAPEYPKIPAQAYPNQVIKVKGKYYLGNKHGVFRRIFPPKVKPDEPKFTKPLTKKEEVLKRYDYKIEHGQKLNQQQISKLPSDLKVKYRNRQRDILDILEKSKRGDPITNEELRKLPMDLQTKVINEIGFRKKQENIRETFKKAGVAYKY